jgi:maleylpyruvate isomerase
MTGVTRRTSYDALRWVEHGSVLFLDAVSGAPETALDQATELPGWSRRHVVAHVAANADALRNLVAWAATGVRTPMYASPAARDEGIRRGLEMPGADLVGALRTGVSELEVSMGRLRDDQWASEVVTAQGRTVPATEIPWLRAREVYVHAVDLGLGVTFADLPDDFLQALVADVEARRGNVPDVDGALPDRVAWLTGRPHGLRGAPDLGAWL